MLRALTEELSQILDASASRGHTLSIDDSARQLQSSPLFHRALEQLLSRDVDGCVKDLRQALQYKAEGTASFTKREYQAATRHYSDALIWLPAASRPAEAAKLHANRALCFIKLASVANDAAARPAPAASGAGVGADAGAEAVSVATSTVRTIVQELAAAAADDCTAALACCEQDLSHKVLFRRAQAHLLLNSYAAAGQDCQAAIAAAQQCGVPGTAAAVQEFQELLQQVEGHGPQEDISTGQLQFETSAVTHSAQQLLRSSHLQQQQPAHGPSLAQLNMLLAYQQRQAQQYLLQQQRHCCAHAQDSLSVLLQRKLCLVDSQKQHSQWSQQQSQPQDQQESACMLPIGCCYSAAKGRYLVAAADTPAGTVLLVEWPLAAVAMKLPKQQQPKRAGVSVASTGRKQPHNSGSSSSGQRCGWCFKVLGISVWPCPACPLALHCSSACRSAACHSSSTDGDASQPTAQGHAHTAEHPAGGLECGRPWVRLLPEEAVLASRCLRAQAAATAVAAASPALTDRPAAASGTDSGGQQLPQQWRELCAQQQELHMEVLRASLLDSLTYHPAEPLTATSSATAAGSSSQSRRGQDSIEQLALASIVAHIHTDSILPAAADSAAAARQHRAAAAAPGAAAVAGGNAAAVLRCLQQLVANGIAIKSLLSAGPEDRWGLGLYPVTAAVVNHDCDPNCSIRIHGRQLLLVCHRGATAGQELAISYGPQVGLHSTQERQALLQHQYGFSCTCSSCCDGLQDLKRQPDSTAQQASTAAAAAGLTAGQTVPVWQREAAAVGLRCCRMGMPSISTLSSASTGDSQHSAGCSGAVVLAQHLPAGVVSLQPLGASSARTSQQQQGQCILCGWVMPRNVMQQKLLLLQAAAANADAACAIMADVSQAQAQDQAQQEEQQLRQVQEAVKLLARAMEARQQHLAAGNQLLGYSHHATAAAAVEAAVLAAAVAGMQHGPASGSTAVGESFEAAPGSLQWCLAVLQDSLAMQTEAEVCSVLLPLQQLLQDMQDKLPARSWASGSRVQSVEAVLQLACSCSQHSGSQQNQPQDAPPLLDAQGLKSAHTASAQVALQSSLLQAFRQFSSSAAVLACNQPQDTLALATERIACCAAGLALVECRRVGGKSCAVCAPRPAGEQQLQQYEQGSCSSCCRCSAVLGVVGDMLRQAVGVVEAHLGWSV